MTMYVYAWVQLKYWKTKPEVGKIRPIWRTQITYWPDWEVWFVRECSSRPVWPTGVDGPESEAGCSGSATMEWCCERTFRFRIRLVRRRWASRHGTRSWRRPANSPATICPATSGTCCWFRAADMSRTGRVVAASGEDSALWSPRSRTWRWWRPVDPASKPTGPKMAGVEARAWCGVKLCCPRTGLRIGRAASPKV